MKFRKILLTITAFCLLLNLTPVIGQTDSSSGNLGKNKETNRKQLPPKEIKDSVKVTTGNRVVLLGSATGWVKSTTGKWLSSQNRIPYYDNDYNNEYYEKNLLGIDNFKAIEVMEMKVDKKPYYALLHRYTKGYYKKPEENEGWTYHNVADYYLIEKKEFKKFMQDSSGFTESRTVSLRSHYTGSVPYTTGTTLFKRIGEDININLQTRHLYDTTVHTYYQFALKPVKTKSGNYMRFFFGIGYAKGDALPPEADYSVFQQQYYQASYDYFKRFMAKLQ